MSHLILEYVCKGNLSTTKNCKGNFGEIKVKYCAIFFYLLLTNCIGYDLFMNIFGLPAFVFHKFFFSLYALHLFFFYHVLSHPNYLSSITIFNNSLL